MLNPEDTRLAVNVAHHNKEVKHLIIDRIEGGFAVCEKDDKEMVNIPLSDLPHGAKQGCVISIIDGSYVIDLEETKRRQEAIQDRFSKLFKK
jgi:hypothetical protein